MELIRRDEILKALRMMKKGKAAGSTGSGSAMCKEAVIRFCATAVRNRSISDVVE